MYEASSPFANTSSPLANLSSPFADSRYSRSPAGGQEQIDYNSGTTNFKRCNSSDEGADFLTYDKNMKLEFIWVSI
jgi:hypothetical protein